MGQKQKKAADFEEFYSSEEEASNNRKTIEEEDDDEEANEDLSLKIVQKSIQRVKPRSDDDPRRNDGVSEIVMDLKKKSKKKTKKKAKELEQVPEDDAVPSEIDAGFKDFCGELFLVDNFKDERNVETEKGAQIPDKPLETNPVEVPDNAVMRKLLRGPRYFDPPDNSWGACYNCGEEGHTTANCTSARRKKPCFVCGSFDHNAKQCSKGRDCFICKQQGHRAKDCPERNGSSRICLKCGDLGHDMFSCRNDYSPDDLKQIQCYVCHEYGHLCCVDYGDPVPREVSCYRCGLSGHTGPACTGSHCDGDNNFTASDNSCYRCGGEGHFARECTSSAKVGKRNREPSTPKQKSSKKNRDHIEARSAPHDLGKARENKRSQYGEYASPAKTKHRGGWITEDPGDFYDDYPNSNYRRSPVTPKDRRAKTPSTNGHYASSSRSSKKHRNLDLNYSASNGSARFYRHTFSASRFGNNSNDGMARNYSWRQY